MNSSANPPMMGFAAPPPSALNDTALNDTGIDSNSWGPPPEFNVRNQFNPSMAITIVVLISALFLVGFLSLYLRRCTMADDDTDGRRPIHQHPVVIQQDSPGSEGLGKLVVESLPIVSYAVVRNLKEGKDAQECAVCLERFEEDENLRLLPKCSHVFHTDCIDVWFLSHSTCPLCRGSLLPTGSEIDAGVPAVDEVSMRILEAQEEIFGSARSSSIQGEEEQADGSEPGRSILGRANDRDSAREALSRNSDSFRQAALGVEVWERLAAALLTARDPAAAAAAAAAASSGGPPINCVNLPRAGSLTASGRREFYSIDIFPYGSHRYGSPSSSSSSPLFPRAGSSNSHSEIPRSSELGQKNATLGHSSSSRDSDQWITMDFTRSVSPLLHSPMARMTNTMDLGSREQILTQTPTSTSTVPLLGTSPHSEPLLVKTLSATNDRNAGGGGGPWEQRVKAETFRGFSNLRGSFLLHRSASEGPPDRLRSSDDGQSPAAPNASARTNDMVEGNGNGNGGANPSFAQRTMQWLASKSSFGRSDSSPRASSTQQQNGL